MVDEPRAWFPSPTPGKSRRMATSDHLHDSKKQYVKCSNQHRQPQQITMFAQFEGAITLCVVFVPVFHHFIFEKQ
jgi:hypothetical protein